jgi:hypothetical protein
LKNWWDHGLDCAATAYPRDDPEDEDNELDGEDEDVNENSIRHVYVFYTHFNTQSANIELSELSLLATTIFGHGLI